MDSDIPDGSSTFDFIPSEGTAVVLSSKNTVLVVLLSVFLFSASAADFYIEGRSRGEIYESGDQVRFVAEAREKANFSVNITQTGLEIGEFDLGLQETFERDNETFYRYTSPYRMNKSEFGVQKALLWGNRSYMSAESEVEWNFSSAGSLSYRVTDDHPNIVSLSDYPSIKFTRSEIFVEVGVADSKENVNSAVLDVAGDTYQMSLVDSSDNYQGFRANFTIDRTGSYSYLVTVTDNSSFQSSASGSFYVEQVPRSDTAKVNVSVDNKCYNVTATLSAPGNEPLNWIRSNTTGAFLGKLYNQGSLPHDLNVSLDVTREGNNSWQPGEEIGPVIVSYIPKEINLSAYNSTEYYRQFRAAYDDGNYTGRMKVDSTCRDPMDNVTREFDFTVTDNFQIVETEGEDSFLTNGSQTVNQSIPADASRRGAESDQTLEGNNPEPGSTVEPEPQPRPSLSLNMETANLSYSSSRGLYQEVGLNITNFANISLQGVQLRPQLEDLRGEWRARSASITSIAPEQDLVRRVFIQAGSNVEPGKYRIPVLAQLTSGRALDVEYVNFRVTRKEVSVPGLSIVEVPRTLSLNRNSSTEIPLLVRNTGETEINNISLEVQNLGRCGSLETESIDSLAVNESSTLKATLDAGQSITECETLFVLSAENGAYSFANVKISVMAKKGIVPPEFRVPLLAFAWTAVLVLYAVLTRRYSLESVLVKFPFLLLILGESVIVLYLAAEYYSLIPSGVLPF